MQESHGSQLVQVQTNGLMKSCETDSPTNSPAGSQLTSEPAGSSNAVLNIASYRFVYLDNLEQRRVDLKQLCTAHGLLGTILLSPEGINMFLAGETESVRGFLKQLQQDPAFANLDVKESFSDRKPFRRMLVRLKNEIISFGVPSVRPVERTSPKLPARELKQWLDEGRPVRLLDTRNDYEVDLGTFTGAEHFSIGHFREFPKAIEQLPEEAKKQPLVMFCTGGIRCEKAGPLMEQAGFEQVYQLDGGILKYFEECGGAHYDGACFVFDGRVALDPQLQPTGNLLCFACQAVLSAEDVQSEKFSFGEYCPTCYVPPQEQQSRELEKRGELVRAYASSQPGCEPYDNLREIHVAGRFAGLTLLDFLDAYQPRIGRPQWQHWIAAGQIVHEQSRSVPERSNRQSNEESNRHSNKLLVLESEIVREGQCFEQHLPNTTEPPINPDIVIIHEDSSIVVVNKPAPLPVHPSGRFNRNSLLPIVNHAYPNEKLRVAHRLDANTTGLVVLCRKHQSARFIQPQFDETYSRNKRVERIQSEFPPVEKTYLARVHGHPSWTELRCSEAISAEPTTPTGARAIDVNGQAAATDFRVLERCRDGTSLVEVKPQSGRTHQIRIHLWHLEHAIVGDPLYLADHKYGDQATLTVEQPPMCLHALRIRFVHPDSLTTTTFEAPLPHWAKP